MARPKRPEEELSLIHRIGSFFFQCVVGNFGYVFFFESFIVTWLSDTLVPLDATRQDREKYEDTKRDGG